jgi:hypothetical protein
MSQLPSDRNIVRATSSGVRMSVNYGSANDDFNYADDGGVTEHEDTNASGKQLGVKVIFQGGHAEIQWAHGDDFMSEHSLDGYVNVNADTGALSFNFWSVDDLGNQRVPFWVEFTDTGLKVYTHEGQPHDSEREQWLCFDSNTIN